MGLILEFHALDPALVPGGAADIAFARTHGIQVADVSINSAALAHLQEVLVNTELAPVFTRAGGTADGIFFAREALLPLLRNFPQDGPEGFIEIQSALEEAVEDAHWRECGLWIGAA